MKQFFINILQHPPKFVITQNLKTTTPNNLSVEGKFNAENSVNHPANPSGNLANSISKIATHKNHFANAFSNMANQNSHFANSNSNLAKQTPQTTTNTFQAE